MCVCLSAFYRPHDICPLCGAASESRRAGAVESRAAPCDRASMHSESTRAQAVQLLNKKNRTLRWCLSKTKTYARSCCCIRNCRDFQKKGKKKTNMPLPKFSLQFAFSWSVYFSNRTESYSAQIEFADPMESRRTRWPTFTAEERLERRREQDRRRHAERRAGERREQPQAWRDLQRLHSWLFM